MVHSLNVEVFYLTLVETLIIQITKFLHFGPWQRGTVFENVRIGEHIIYVRDLLNCNEISEKKIVIGYPKFFTPNGDGYHDTWNIVGMTVKSSSKIYIFDRYGKLLK